MADRITDELRTIVASHDHRISVQKTLEFRHAAPHYRATPTRRPFVRVQDTSGYRVDTVTGDEEPALNRCVPRSTLAVPELRRTPRPGWASKDTSRWPRCRRSAPIRSFAALSNSSWRRRDGLKFAASGSPPKYLAARPKFARPAWCNRTVPGKPPPHAQAVLAAPFPRVPALRGAVS